MASLNAAWRDFREVKNELTLDDGNSSTLWLLSAELFPAHVRDHTPDTHKLLHGSIHQDFKTAIAWMLKQRSQMDIVVVADGRSECARREIRKEFERHLEHYFFGALDYL